MSHVVSFMLFISGLLAMWACWISHARLSDYLGILFLVAIAEVPFIIDYLKSRRGQE
jgi:hypothetical protein